MGSSRQVYLIVNVSIVFPQATMSRFTILSALSIYKFTDLYFDLSNVSLARGGWPTWFVGSEDPNTQKVTFSKITPSTVFILLYYLCRKRFYILYFLSYSVW